MKYKNKLFLSLTLLFLSLFLVVGIIILKLEDKKEIKEENKIPQINIKYNEVSYKVLKQYNGFLYYDETSKDIINYNDNNKYIIGSYSKLYSSPIIYNNDIYEENKCYNYYIEYDNNTKSYYYIKDNTKSDPYNFISTIRLKDDINNCIYLILKNDKGLSLLNCENGKYFELDKNIIGLNGYGGEENFSIFSKKDNLIFYDGSLYGFVDLEGNIVLEATYERIIQYNSEYYIAKYNGKYGIINKNNDVLLDFKYDGIEIYDNYIMTIKNDKIGILDRNYDILVNYSIPYNSYYKFENITYDESNIVFAKEINELLYLQVLSNPDNYNLNKEDYDKYTKLYIINKNGVQEIFNGSINDLNVNDYFCIIYNNDSIYTFTFYDEDLNYKVMYSLKASHNEINHWGSVNIVNNYIYRISIDYSSDLDINNDYAYININNKETIDEKEAYIKYFENGYAYSTLNQKLEIYRKDELLNSFDLDVKSYIGDYMFIIKENNLYKIIKIRFN